jgi:hypothetical protein
MKDTIFREDVLQESDIARIQGFKKAHSQGFVVISLTCALPRKQTKMPTAPLRSYARSIG